MSYSSIITTPIGIPLGKLELWIPDSCRSIRCRIPTEFESAPTPPYRLCVWSQHLGELIDLGAEYQAVTHLPDEVELRRETSRVFSCPENRVGDMWRYDAFTPLKSGIVYVPGQSGFSWCYDRGLWRIRLVYRDTRVIAEARTPRLASEKLSIELGKAISRMKVQRCLQES